MILSIQICYFREPNLITTVLVLQIIKIIFAPSDNVDSIVVISSHYSIITNTYKIGRLVGSISLMAWNILPLSMTTLSIINIVSIMRAILRWLLTIYHCNTVDIIILVMIFVTTSISSSDKLLFSSFQAHRSIFRCII